MRIYERVKEIEKDYREIETLTSEISNLHNRLVAQVDQFAPFTIRRLRPFRSPPLVKVEVGSGSFYSICTDIRMLFDGQPVGSSLGYESFASLIRSHGEKFVPYVKPLIRNEFAELVSIAKAMRKGGEVSVPYAGTIGTLESWRGFRMVDWEIARITIRSEKPRDIFCAPKRQSARAVPTEDYLASRGLNIEDLQAVPAVDALLPAILPMYRRLKKDLEKAVAENDRLSRSADAVLGRLVLTGRLKE